MTMNTRRGTGELLSGLEKDIRIPRVKKKSLCRQTRRRPAQWRPWNPTLQFPRRWREGGREASREERVQHERNDSWADGESQVIPLASSPLKSV